MVYRAVKKCMLGYGKGNGRGLWKWGPGCMWSSQKPKVYGGIFKYLYWSERPEGADLLHRLAAGKANCKVEGLIHYGFLIILIISIIKETAGVQWHFRAMQVREAIEIRLDFREIHILHGSRLISRPYFNDSYSHRIWTGAMTLADICLATKGWWATARWTQYGILSPIMRLHSSWSEWPARSRMI